jgi:hypothetical protein
VRWRGSSATFARPATAVAHRGVRTAIGLAAAAVGAVAISGVAPSADAATGAKTTSFTLTGGVNGTLTVPYAKCKNGDQEFQFANQMLSGSANNFWTVFITTPSARGGTWTKFGHSAANQTTLGVQLQTQSSSGATEWVTESGRLTTLRGTGRVNVTLGFEHSYTTAPGFPTVHMTGTWGCNVRAAGMGR